MNGYHYSILDHNYLNAKRGEAASFSLQLARRDEPFYVAVHSPGFLQLFERGPFTLADATNGVLEIDVPKPAVLEVSFDPNGGTAAMPFDSVKLDVLRTNPDNKLGLFVATQDGDVQRRTLRLADLAPGTYRVHLNARRKPDKTTVPPANGDSVVYRDGKEIVLGAGETGHLDFRYKRLDAAAFRGDCSATIRISNPDGSPAVGRKVTVSYLDENHSYVEVFSGTTPTSGELVVQNLTDRRPENPLLASFGAYKVDVDGHKLGSFSFAKSASSEAFAYQLPPQVGDIAPDIDLVNVATSVHTNLRDLRGKVVCLELWATWCGPCQQAMAKLNQLAAEKRDKWRGRVVIVPLSIDERPEDVSRHVKKRAWDQLDHYWSETDASNGSNSKPDKDCEAVPRLLIIDHTGRVAWRGHPADDSDGKDVAARIEEALKR